MHCDHAFYVGGTHENADVLGELERLPGCCGVKVFMGASTGDLLVADDDGVERVLRQRNRRAAFHSEDEYRLAERRPLARNGDWTSHPRCATPRPAMRSTRGCCGWPRAGSASASTCCTSPPPRRWHSSRGHKDVATVEVTPQHLTLAAPEAYERLGASPR